MVKRFNGLWHHAIICGHHEDRDIGDFGTTSTHSGERFVTRSINERDGTTDAFMHSVDLICTDVLSDSTRLATDHFGLANRIEHASLTVINVTHDSDNWRTCHQLRIFDSSDLRLEVDVELFEEFFIFIFGRDDLNGVAQFCTEQHEGVFIH